MRAETKRLAELLRARLLLANIPCKIYLHWSEQELEPDKKEIHLLQKELYERFPELKPKSDGTYKTCWFNEETQEERKEIIRKLRLALGKIR